MFDPRVVKLGELLVDYSLELRPGHQLRIDAGTVAAPLVTEAYRSAVRAFDEKIGGTLHMALGSSVKKLGGENESGLHRGLICDLSDDGEVYADGELVWKAGRFLHEPGLVAAAS